MKIMSDWTGQNKSSAPSYAGETKDSLRAAGTIPIEELADYTFKSIILADGTLLEDISFETLVDTLWKGITKSSAPAYTSETKN